MNKRRYHGVEFKKVDWNQVCAGIEGERVVVGVDVAKEDFVATVLDAQQTVLLTFKWRHPQDTGAVLDRLVRLGDGRRLDVAMEPSGTYGDALAWQLRQRGVALYRVSPKRVHDVAEVYDGVPSLHDAKAAYLIGQLHLQAISQPWPEPSADRRELKAVLTELGVVKARQHAASNRLEAHLSRHWPETLGLLGLDSVALLELIRSYGDPAAVADDRPEAAALLRRTGHAGLSEDKIHALLASAAHSLGVPCLGAERELLQWLAADVLAARQQVRQIERQIAHHVQHEPVLASLAKVVGTVTAAVLLAAVGSPRDYSDTASYLKALGLNLKERSSGKHKGQLKITKRGPSVARFYLYFAALRLIVRDPLVKRWYDARINRLGGAPKNKTVIALMRKLAKALWHVARGAALSSEKLFNRNAVAGA